MTRKEICNILNCSNSYISKVINGKYPTSAKASKVRKLLKLNYTLQETFEDIQFDNLCEAVIAKANQKQFPVTAHAVTCLRIRRLLMQKKAQGDKVIPDETSNEEALVEILSEGNNILEKFYLDDKFSQMCEIVLAKSRDRALRIFAGNQLYISIELKKSMK